MNQNKKLSTTEKNQLLEILHTRFEKNINRHPNIQWQQFLAKLEPQAQKIAALYAMENSDGEPDVIAYDAATDSYTIADCATESPVSRRSLCYDEASLEARKENKPKHSALGMATEMGVEVMNEEQYHTLQSLGAFDTKTSSWLSTPSELRALGGAIFGDRRFNRVFVYHNGVSSYYAGRGFRGVLFV